MARRFDARDGIGAAGDRSGVTAGITLGDLVCGIGTDVAPSFGQVDLADIEITTYQGAARECLWQPTFGELLLHRLTAQVGEPIHLDRGVHPDRYFALNPLQQM